MKILIAIPCMDQVHALFAQSLATLNRVGECAVAFQTGSLIYTSRNNLGRQAIEHDFDYVLWLDSDMVFTPDLLERMLKTMQENDLDFLTGTYFRRVAPYTPVLYDLLEYHENGGANWSEYKKLPTEGLIEVGGCGFGCVLMSTEILMSVQGRFGTMFHPLPTMGEDLAFCWRARECGYKLMCDAGLVVGHVGTAVVNDAFWRAYEG